MNLVGKIFVILIAVMSLVFMSFAMAVYATHKNWRDVITNPDNGLAKELKNQQDKNKELADEVAKKIHDLEAERQAKSEVLTKLETELVAKKEELETRKQKQDELEKSERALAAAMSTTQTNATDYRKSLETLRADILQAQKERDLHFNEVVKLTDQLNQLENDRKQLRDRNVELAKDVSRADELLRKLGYDKNRNYSNVPPDVEGVITATPGANMVEVSIGADQGLIPGHVLQIYRIGGGQSTYVGRVEVIKTTPDRAVCKIDPNYQKSNVMVGDRVATKIK
jgi:hypothetical protein